MLLSIVPEDDSILSPGADSNLIMRCRDRSCMTGHFAAVHESVVGLATNSAGLADVPCRRQSGRDLLAVSITAHDPSETSWRRSLSLSYAASVSLLFGQTPWRALAPRWRRNPQAGFIRPCETGHLGQH